MTWIGLNPWRLRVLSLLALLFGVLLAAALGRTTALAEAKRPDIVVIQTDDQTSRMLHARYVDRHGKRLPVMPNTLRLIAGQGVEFTDYYASIPVCSPSRSTLLSGQYGHTTGLIRNLGRLGGASGIARSRVYDRNVAVSLREAGYRTAHFGRFVNGYGASNGIDDPAIPPGWTSWATDWTPGPVRRFYGYDLNVNGKVEGPFGKVRYGRPGNKDSRRCPSLGLRCDYHTDQITTRAVRNIRNSPRGPIYVQIDYQAPHGAPGNATTEPASRHIGSARRTPLPRPPSFNERVIRDKPAKLRRGSRRLSEGEIARLSSRWKRELESLRSVDESVGRIVRTLRSTGRLDSTYIFFVSDNGAFFGEHRYANSKFLAYEPSANVPLVVRGPGVKRGAHSGAVLANVDLAPTIADLAGARLQLRPDGRSFRSILKYPRRVGRRAIVIESYRLPSRALYAHLESNGIEVPDDLRAHVSASVPAVNFAALRAGRYKYVEYEGGGRELYDLRLDPDELSNRVGWPAYARAAAKLERQMKWRRFCEGRTCRKGTGRIPGPRPHLRGS